MRLRWLILAFFSLLLFEATACQEVITWLGATMYQGGGGEAADSCTAAQLVREGFDVRPRIRVGYLPSPTLGTVFRGRQDLGQHGYGLNLTEKNGIAYTCNAGHIDIGHTRKAADWTLFLAAKTFQQIRKNKTDSSFKLYEPSQYFVRLTYPENWKNLSADEKENIAYDVSVGLGQYFAYVGSTWHEIVTWLGFKSKGFEPEHPSAFTWEETFSNLLGTHIAVLALRDTQHTYDKAVTLALDRELQNLNDQSKQTSKRAAESVRGLCFTGDFFFLGMQKRHFDIGVDDGFVTPWLVPSVCECEGAKPQPYPVPALDFLSEYGFLVKFEIEPRIWEADTILKIAYPDANQRKKRIEPAVHLALIMDYIRKDAAKRYGPDVNLCD